MASCGLRTLAIAKRTVGAEEAEACVRSGNIGALEDGLTLVALLGIKVSARSRVDGRK
jgi:hypothetical protein